jgi:ubiquinone/menaquinone biosynthesis C-methylase UbiE
MPKDLERFVPELRGRIAYEHRHRYAICCDHVADKEVLDIACGEGYGSAMLATSARRVVGADLNQEVINQAAQKYGQSKRLQFKVASCTSLPFVDGSFDVVISFETIEHITEQADFITEVARVLKTNGTFIVSTPNRIVYSEEPSHHNPFHQKELDQQELRELLEQQFKYVQLFGQRFYAPSVVGPLAKKGQDTRNATYRGLVTRDNGSLHVGSGVVGVDHAQYFIAVCSNARVRRYIGIPSVYIDETDDLWREQDSTLSWASHLHDEDQQLRQRLHESETHVEQLNTVVGDWTSLRRELADAKAEQQIVHEKLERLNDALRHAQRAFADAEDRFIKSTTDLVTAQNEKLAAQQELAALREDSEAAARAAARALD